MQVMIGYKHEDGQELSAYRVQRKMSFAGTETIYRRRPETARKRPFTQSLFAHTMLNMIVDG